MVSLAKRLQNRPFHLVATHCQNAPQAEVVAYIKSKGVEASTPNFTVSSFGGHPKVKGNGYVPYYMVFDHTGRLVQHHMCGDYHGGDGLKMIDWVDKLLAKTPDIYLGEEKFELAKDLAAKVASVEKMPSVIAEIEKGLAAENSSAELKTELSRLMKAVTRWRDNRIEEAEANLGQYPSKVLGMLASLEKDLRSNLRSSEDQFFRIFVNN